MRSFIWLGAMIGLLGICGLAIPVFTTSQPQTVVAVGDLKIQKHGAIYPRGSPGAEYRCTHPGSYSYRRRNLRKAPGGIGLRLIGESVGSPRYTKAFGQGDQS